MDDHKMYGLLTEGTQIREAIKFHQSLKDHLYEISEKKEALGVVSIFSKLHTFHNSFLPNACNLENVSCI
jgi:hypothetical protein